MEPRALDGEARLFCFFSVRTCSTQSARFGYRQTEMKHNIQNKQVDNSSQPGPKPKTTTRVRVLQPARFGYTGANGNEAHQIQNKQVDNSSLYQIQPKTTRLQKRVSCGVVPMASTMLHDKCFNTVLQIGAPLFLSLSLSLCLCSRVPHTTISPFLYLLFYFFAPTTKCLYKRHLFSNSLLARIIYRFVTTGLILCTPLYATQHFSP